VGGLGFGVLHQDEALTVVQRDGAKAYPIESADFAAKDRPQIETDTTDDIYRGCRRGCHIFCIRTGGRPK
jgi:hypothetical protein